MRSDIEKSIRIIRKKLKIHTNSPSQIEELRQVLKNLKYIQQREKNPTSQETSMQESTFAGKHPAL